MRTYDEILRTYSSRGFFADMLCLEKIELALCQFGTARTWNEKIANHFSDIGFDVYQEKDSFGDTVYCVEIPEENIS